MSRARAAHPGLFARTAHISLEQCRRAVAAIVSRIHDGRDEPGLGDMQAAFDGDGALTIFDFLLYQIEFDAGCDRRPRTNAKRRTRLAGSGVFIGSILESG
jgi:hypothetical protein